MIGLYETSTAANSAAERNRLRRSKICRLRDKGKPEEPEPAARLVRFAALAGESVVIRVGGPFPALAVPRNLVIGELQALHGFCQFRQILLVVRAQIELDEIVAVHGDELRQE